MKRTALVKYNNQAALMIERHDGLVEFPLKDKMLTELQEMGSKFSHTKNIKDFFFHAGFPVDVRHNIKIDRVKLSQSLEKRD